MMRYFKLPLMVTGICFMVALVATIVAVIWIQKSDISNAEKAERAKSLGMAVGMAGSLIPAPFWIFAAGRYGKDRREEQEQEQERMAAESAGDQADGDA